MKQRKLTKMPKILIPQLVLNLFHEDEPVGQYGIKL